MAAAANKTMGGMMEYKLNDGLDPKALAKAYKKAGRLQVPEALIGAAADALSETIEKMAIWRTVYLKGDEECTVAGADLRSITARRQRDMLQNMYSQARDGYQYVRYECATDNIPNAKDPKALTDADEFFKSDGFRDFLRAVAGVKDGELENVHARWLQREQFMADSDLAGNLPDCKLSFSMDVTRKWRPHWGGQLNFIDPDGAIEEAWSPAFNMLNIYAGGSRHSISYVAPFHGAFCLSICGRLV
jgi:hypothetical protein